MDMYSDITLTVNGESVTRCVESRTNLVDFLRYELGLTGSHVGCEHGVCGACTIRMDGRIVRGCLTLAAQAEGAEVDVPVKHDHGGVADGPQGAVAAGLRPTVGVGVRRRR